MKLAAFALGVMAFGQQPAFDDLAKLFAVDAKQPHEMTLAESGAHDGVRNFDFSFASPVSGRVPGVVLMPDRPGRTVDRRCGPGVLPPKVGHCAA